VRSTDVALHVLAGLPVFQYGGETKAREQAAMACMLGSVAQIGASTRDEIAAVTDLDPGSAARVEAFFCRGTVEAQ
jgi:hypothetical protein